MAAVPRSTAQTASLRNPVTNGVVFSPAGTLIPAKPHAPFSAVLVGRMEQTLNDGTNISRDNQEVVKRDGTGRTYRARTIGRARSNESEPWSLITITDSVRHVQYLCNSLLKSCTKMEYRLPPNLHRPQAPDAEKMPGVTVEDLGPSNISRVEVEGKRVTRVIAEGMVGNDRPFTTTEELWHSNELDLDLQVKRTDPRMGTSTTTMTEVNVGEPDPNYFQIPEGYRVQETRRPAQPLAPLSTTVDRSYSGSTLR